MSVLLQGFVWVRLSWCDIFLSSEKKQLVVVYVCRWKQMIVYSIRSVEHLERFGREKKAKQSRIDEAWDIALSVAQCKSKAFFVGNFSPSSAFYCRASAL